jgi:hypothetical protein
VIRLKWKLDSVHLEIVLILAQDRCTVCDERTTSSEIILDTPIELLADVDHVESHFGPFGDSVSVSAREVHGLRQMYHRLRNCFGHTRWYSYVIRLTWKLDSFHSEIVLILMQDMSTVCVERTTG